MRTKDKYHNSLKSMKPNIYIWVEWFSGVTIDFGRYL